MRVITRGPNRKTPKKMNGKKNKKAGGGAPGVVVPAAAATKKRPMTSRKTKRKRSIGRKKPRSLRGFPSQRTRSPGGISKLTTGPPRGRAEGPCGKCGRSRLSGGARWSPSHGHRPAQACRAFQRFDHSEVARFVANTCRDPDCDRAVLSR